MGDFKRKGVDVRAREIWDFLREDRDVGFCVGVGPFDVGMENVLPVGGPGGAGCGGGLGVDPGALEEGGVVYEVELGAFVVLDAVHESVMRTTRGGKGRGERQEGDSRHAISCIGVVGGF